MGREGVDRLAQDLRSDFPDMKGFSRANLMYMRAFAEAWPDAAIVQQVVGQLPWGHNLVKATLSKDVASIRRRDENEIHFVSLPIIVVSDHQN